MLRAALFSQLFSGIVLLSAETARPAWGAPNDAGAAAFWETRYQDALALFRQAYTAAEKAGAPDADRGRILTRQGACLMGLSDYRAALALFLHARAFSVRGGNLEDLAVLEANIASVYLFQDDRENAARLYRQALGRLSPSQASRHRPPILANLAAVEARAGRHTSALRYAQQAVAALSNQAMDSELRGRVHELAGQAHLGLRQYAPARQAFERSLALAQAGGPRGDVSRSLMFLGRVDSESGNPEQAVTTLSQAIDRARQRDSRVTLWEALFWRGRVLRQMGRPAEAAADLRQSVQTLETMRAGLVPTDALRVQFDTYHNEVYRELAGLAAGLGDTEEAFHVVELSRAHSLRELVARTPRADGREPTLGSRYAERLLRLETMRGRAQAATAEADQKLWSTRLAAEEAALRELEARIRVEDPLLGHAVLAPALSLLQAQSALATDDLLLNYWAGDQESYLWALTRTDAALYRLPAPRTWLPSVRRFIEAVQSGSAEQAALGKSLYRTLIEPVDPRLRQRTNWIVAAEGDLALAPLAALRAPSGRYLIEDRALSYVPSVSVLQGLRARPLARYRREFLGLADPVLNQADRRGAGVVRCPEEQACAPMARLVATEAEVQACARLFGPAQATILTGLQATESGIRQAASSPHRFWHFSSHVVVDAERPNLSFIALTLPERLTVYDIAGLPARAEMVTVNGCDSGKGKWLPGAGMLGLARAFLAAGAQSACVTAWKIPDEGGALVERLYGHVRAGARRAEALRRAQVEMIRASGWRAEPRYWAAYFLVGDGGAAPAP